MPREAKKKENYSTTLASRYLLSSSEFEGNFYVHLKDIYKGKQVSLNLEGLEALHNILPSVLKKAHRNKKLSLSQWDLKKASF